MNVIIISIGHPFQVLEEAEDAEGLRASKIRLRELLQVQVLDDSTDETTQIAADRITELKAAGLDIELIHRSDRTGFKAGALEAGLNSCKGEFVLILDADFVPAPDMLRKTIHFFTDPQIGTVGREVCEALMERGVLVKDTHGSTIRFAPPMCITKADADFLLAVLDEAFAGV